MSANQKEVRHEVVTTTLILTLWCKYFARFWSIVQAYRILESLVELLF
jgi:hypothetical protein